MIKEEDNISYDIRGAAFKVYNELGPGLLESVYEAAMAYELTKINRKIQTQCPIPVIYNEVKLELGFRLDLLVDDLVIIEVKSIEMLLPVHHKQLLTYLKINSKEIGNIDKF